MTSPIKSLNELLNPSEKKNGFFDLEEKDTCNNPEHEPPRHLHIPQGKGYKHVCPKCGNVTVIIPPQIKY